MFKVTEDHVFVEIPQGYKTFAEEVLGGVYSKKWQAHRFPKNYFAMRELARAFPVLLQDQRFVGTGVQLGEARQRIALAKSKTDTAGDVRLRPYQKCDIEYLQTLPAAGVFNEPRTGKSATSIKVFEEQGLKKNCVVCPASLIYNWEQEIQKWTDASTFVVTGSLDKRKKIYAAYKKASEGYLIISYETLRKDVELVETL